MIERVRHRSCHRHRFWVLMKLDDQPMGVDEFGLESMATALMFSLNGWIYHLDRKATHRHSTLNCLDVSCSCSSSSSLVEDHTQSL